MNSRHRLPFQLTAASVLVLAATGALAQDAAEPEQQVTPYAPLAL